VKIFDSSKKQKLPFIPMQKNRVKMYVCGPTVYDDAHLGHARSAVCFDLLYRVLLANNYEVEFARNYTDIDDKIINKAKETNQDINELTNYYINRFEEDMKKLNILEPTIKPKATQNLDNMISLVECLLKKDYAYKTSDGIYLDTSKDEYYGSISQKVINEDELINRIEQNKSKKNQKDFALWKFSKDVTFKAPFGDGRPGWHCECSAMIDRYLSDKNLPYAVDIHGGGADLLFPHHENEATQSRCCYNQELAKYWVHNGFVKIDGQKMSKSLGNSFYLKDALKFYDGEVIRFYLITAHYRADFNFNELDLLSSKKRLDKLYRLKKLIFGVKESQNLIDKKLIEIKQNLFEALNDDLNTPIALSFIDEFITYSNESLNKNPKDKNLKKDIALFFKFLNEILGIGFQDPYNYFQFGLDKDLKEKIEQLIQKRNEAKKEKNYIKADKIRNELNQMGINIMDTPQKTVWEKI